jgi:paraquat-inducible protein B
MSGQSRSALSVGAFFIGAIVLILIGILFFSRGGLFQRQVTAVAYFDGSLSGLSVGAPVNFRGVRVGYVENIVLRLERHDENLRIPVYIRLSEKAAEWNGDERGRISIEQLVERGLRAQLGLQSVVTGQLLVELDFLPDAPARFHGSADSDEPSEIPTLPSDFAQLIDFLTTLPIRETVDAAREALQAIERAAGELTRVVETASVVLTDATPVALETLERLERDFSRFSSQATASMQSVDRTFAGMGQDFGAVAEELRETSREARATLSGVAGLLSEEAPLHRDIEDAARDLSISARSLRALAEELEERPNALIFGR